MDQKELIQRYEEEQRLREEAVRIATEEGFDAGLAYLVEHGMMADGAAVMLGLDLGMEHKSYDEDGMILFIRN